VRAQLHAALPRDRKARLGAFGDQARFQFGHGCHLRDHETAHCAWDMRQVAKEHLDAAVEH
jgi:hypothetical protein